MRDIQDCRDNGFGLVQDLDGDGMYNLTIVFDEDGNTAALAFLDSTNITENVVVRATGMPSAEDDMLLTSVSIDLVPQVCAGDPVTVFGYLVDILCWELENHIAVDGADLLNSPEDHTVHCMRDIQACRDSGFGILVRQADGTFDLEYAFDDVGNAAALALIDETSLVEKHRIDGADLLNSPEEHTVHCMRDIQACRDSGFGILVLQADGTYNLEYAFDDVGNAAALALIDETGLVDNVTVTVTAELTGELVTTNNVAELTSVNIRLHETISHTGFLIDILCWELDGHVAIDGADLDANPEFHSIHCMRDIQECRENGHGILELADDGCSYELAYSFDDVGNQLALDYVDSTSKIDNVIVTVTGERDTDGIVFVETLVETDYEVHEGFLIDLFCWERDGHVAIDGANLVTEPEAHTIHCMRDIQDCRDNGFGLVQDLDGDGMYNLTIVFDEDGNTAALAFLDSTNVTENVVVRATGMPSTEDDMLLTSVSIDLVPQDCDAEVPAPTAADVVCDASPSDNADFEHMTELDSNVQLYWTIEYSGDQAEDFYPAIRAQVVMSGDGWVGLGYSLDENMEGSFSVISTDGAAPEKYELVGRTDPELMDSASQTLVDATTEVVDGNLVMSFTKTLAEDGEVEIGESGTDWGYFLYAYGEGSLAYHNTERGATLVDLSPVCDPDATPSPTPEPTFSFAPTASSSCVSDDADYDFAFSVQGLSSMVFYWRILEGSDVPAGLESPALRGRMLNRGTGYVSLALSEDNFMPGSDSIVGEEGSIPEKYELTSRSDSGVTRRSEGSQTLTETSCEVTVIDGVEFLDCRFVKQMVESGEIEIVAGLNTFLFAIGSGGLDYHGSDRVVVSLNLLDCSSRSISSDPVSSSAIKVHGMLMIAAWAYCAPLGVIFARFKTCCLRLGLFKTWLYAHMFIQLLALVLTASGFAKAYEAIKDADGIDHLTYRHPKLGVGVMVAGVIQLIMGVLRPHPPHKGEEKSIARWTFEGMHRLFGYGGIVLAVVTMLSGIEKAMELRHISAQTPWNTAVIAPVATTVFILIVTTVYIFLTAGQSGYEPAASGDAEKLDAGKGDVEMEATMDAAGETADPDVKAGV
eukprot:CAMPEP_0197411020 /NCGR_PEP_ID=MMETSP1165-20131217/31749_1 /TAXON_ID=284809 /ORGANISM="Chrysocystis fragilis, Strain CCMP3189" /LENGTH=1098 /DNA_ID=CAMNT_0042937531 /DNA_START=1 /DNA_END=3298 /DNA_ORIENTATION=+